MKKLTTTLIFTLLLSVAFTGYSQAQGTSKAKAKKSAKVDQSEMPYKALYSADFEMADPAKSRMVLEFWKDYDDNAFERHADMLADTAIVYLSDGNVIKGKEKMLADIKTYRSSMADAKSDVHAYMSFRSVDKDHDWVAIWGTENNTMKDGTKMSTNLHEVWQFNKDGKVAVIRQFASKLPPTE